MRLQVFWNDHILGHDAEEELAVLHSAYLLTTALLGVVVRTEVYQRFNIAAVHQACGQRRINVSVRANKSAVYPVIY